MTRPTVGASLPADQPRPRDPGAALSVVERRLTSSSDVLHRRAPLTPREARRSSTGAVVDVTVERVPRPSTSPPTPQLLTVAEVCAALQLQPATVRRYIARGTIRGARVGRELRVDRVELQRFLDDAVVTS